jgi:DNA-binding PadR family transcriptional regulator
VSGLTEPLATTGPCSHGVSEGEVNCSLSPKPVGGDAITITDGFPEEMSVDIYGGDTLTGNSSRRPLLGQQRQRRDARWPASVLWPIGRQLPRRSVGRQKRTRPANPNLNTISIVGERLKKERTVSMRSPLNWTVLGLLIERPSYGYELWKRFERLYGDVLDGTESGIYTALNALNGREFIEEMDGPRSSVRDASRQPKPRYRATRAGLDAYERWVIAQVREHSRRSLQFARQLGAFAEQPGTALEILSRYEQACLDDKGARVPTASEFPTRVVPGLADRLASAYGRSVQSATLGWIGYARAEFEAILKAPSR